VSEHVAVGVAPDGPVYQPNTPTESRRMWWRTWLLASPGRSWYDSRAGWALRIGIHLLLLSMLTAVSVSLVRSLLPPRTTSEPRIVNPPVVTHTASVTPIIAAHLFGTPASAETHPGTPSLSTSDITLLGIVYAVDPTRSRAILSAHGHTNVVGVGDTLVAGASVAAIEPRSVLLRQNGRSVSLELSFVTGGTDNDPSSSQLLAQNVSAGLQDASLALPGSDNSVTGSSEPALRAVSIPVSASPLEQMRDLRANLVQGHPQRYLDRSRLARKFEPPGQ
jgi:type II secretory pathway component PulC